MYGIACEQATSGDRKKKFGELASQREIKNKSGSGEPVDIVSDALLRPLVISLLQINRGYRICNFFPKRWCVDF